MTLEDFAYASQIVSVVVIVGSVAAVYWQVRQTNQIAKAELTHNAWLAVGNFQHSFYDTPDKADLMHRALLGTSPLSDAEQLRMNTVLLTVIGAHQAGYFLRQRGLIEESCYREMQATTHQYLRSPFVQHWWKRHRQDKDTEFATLLDGMAAEIETERAIRRTQAAAQSEREGGVAATP